MTLLALLSACSDNPGVGDTAKVAPKARLVVIPEVGTSRTHISLDPQTSNDVDDRGSTLQFRLDLDNQPWSPLGTLPPTPCGCASTGKVLAVSTPAASTSRNLSGSAWAGACCRGCTT
ncbi:MAG: hypothetical protein H6678_13195 [Candidatus Delongbacteria bacterium]|nr:hypothetical protein [Candidatus Delongbacteria bacterium]